VAGARKTLVARTPSQRIRSALGAAAGTLQSAATSVPRFFFALAGLSTLLLGIASMPRPLGTSRTGAVLAHHRGAIALAGVGVLITGVLAFIAL
jgi:hypothetical protein